MGQAKLTPSETVIELDPVQATEMVSCLTALLFHGMPGLCHSVHLSGRSLRTLGCCFWQHVSSRCTGAGPLPEQASLDCDSIA